MGVYLQTERLRLRHFTDGDADLLVNLDDDPAVMHFITGGEATPLAEVEQEVLPAFLGYYRRWSHLGFWAVEEKSSGDFVGWFHLRPGPDHTPQEPELGYRLRRECWGRGYAVEGSRALDRPGVWAQRRAADSRRDDGGAHRFAEGDGEVRDDARPYLPR